MSDRTVFVGYVDDERVQLEARTKEEAKDELKRLLELRWDHDWEEMCGVEMKQEPYRVPRNSEERLYATVHSDHVVEPKCPVCDQTMECHRLGSSAAHKCYECDVEWFVEVAMDGTTKFFLQEFRDNSYARQINEHGDFPNDREIEAQLRRDAERAESDDDDDEDYDDDDE